MHTCLKCQVVLCNLAVELAAHSTEVSTPCAPKVSCLHFFLDLGQQHVHWGMHTPLMHSRQESSHPIFQTSMPAPANTKGPRSQVVAASQ